MRWISTAFSPWPPRWPAPWPSAGERLAALKQQRQALEAEIAAVTRSAELEAEVEQQEPLTATKTRPAAASKRAMAQQPR